MFSVDEIKELLGAFDASKATSLELRNEAGEVFKVSQKNETISLPAAPVTEHAAQEKQQPAAPFIHEKKEQEDDGTPVTSPMVGVFYSAPSPDKEPYVSVGSSVSKGDVLCLIEAMKLMNEVTAEKSGTITAVCVDNGQVVEYGQKLFMIK